MPALLDDDILSCENSVDAGGVAVQPDVANLQIGQSFYVGISFSGDAVSGVSSRSLTSGNTQYFAAVNVSCVDTATYTQQLVFGSVDALQNLSVLKNSSSHPYIADTNVTLALNYISSAQAVFVRLEEENFELTNSVENFGGAIGTGAAGLQILAHGVDSASCSFGNVGYQKIIPPVNLTYSYNAMNQLLAINGTDNATFVYDDLGNMTSQNWTKEGITQTTTFAYDALNRQTQSGSQSSTYYGASGLRKTTTFNGITTTFTHDGNTCLSSISPNGTTNYFVPGSSPLWENSSGQISTYGMERGHVTSLIGSGGVATRFNYDAFGNMTAKTFGSTTVDKSSSGPRYNGYYLDAGSSLSTGHYPLSTDQYATGWRPYRPDIGRFSSLDPAGSPNGPNRYNYCGSDPVNQSDPTGLFWKFHVKSIEAQGDDEVTSDPRSYLAAEWDDESEFGTAQPEPIGGPSDAEFIAADRYFVENEDATTYSAIRTRFVGLHLMTGEILDPDLADFEPFEIATLGGNQYVQIDNGLKLSNGQLDFSPDNIQKAEYIDVFYDNYDRLAGAIKSKNWHQVDFLLSHIGGIGTKDNAGNLADIEYYAGTSEGRQAVANSAFSLKNAVKGAGVAGLHVLTKGKSSRALRRAALVAQRFARNFLNASSRRLAANLLKAGFSRPANAATHHIVAGTAKAAEGTRRILKKFGITDINDAANGVFLPNNKGSKASGAYHPKLHTNTYYREVEMRLKQATSKQEVLKTLGDIKNELLKGTFPF